MGYTENTNRKQKPKHLQNINRAGSCVAAVFFFFFWSRSCKVSLELQRFWNSFWTLQWNSQLPPLLSAGSYFLLFWSWSATLMPRHSQPKEQQQPFPLISYKRNSFKLNSVYLCSANSQQMSRDTLKEKSFEFNHTNWSSWSKYHLILVIKQHRMLNSSFKSFKKIFYIRKLKTLNQTIELEHSFLLDEHLATIAYIALFKYLHLSLYMDHGNYAKKLLNACSYKLIYWIMHI